MDSSSLPPSNSPTSIKSPSNASFSSEVSPASTRTSSPATSSHSSSPLFGLPQFSTLSIEPTSNVLLESQQKMERNAFQSVNLRRDKLMAERGNESNVISNMSPQAQRPFSVQQQPQTLRPSTSVGAQSSRSLISNNWRTQPLGEPIYNSLEPAGSASSPLGQAARGPPSFSVNGLPRLEQPGALMSYPNMAAFSDLQLESCYAYCFDRGNGQYTQLIPADMLPTLQNVPALQQGCQGMIILPTPRAFLPNNRSNNTDAVLMRTPPATPGIPADNIQQQPHPGHHNATGFSSGGSGPQHHHQQQPQRRPKIYCDKWVHEGVCAFTQQGCKYKHEMPFDKVTQHQLGLFHGLPAWWKKHQAELARQREAPQTMSSETLSDGGNSGTAAGRGTNEVTSPHGLDSRSGAGYGTESRVNYDDAAINNHMSVTGWRQQNSHVFGKNGGIEQSQHNNKGFNSPRNSATRGQDIGSRANTSAWHPSPFGPIAPPPPRTSALSAHGIASPPESGLTAHGNLPTNNPYASLEALDDGKTD